MVVLGNIIKAALEITDRVIPGPSHVEAQQDILRHLLEKAEHTEFGKHHRFGQILEAPDMEKAYARHVPYHDYDAMYSEWWKKQLEKDLPDISWPGRTSYYALSAGTTGKESKRIPVTEDMLEAIRKTSLFQILSTANFDFPAEFFEKEIMMLGSSTRLKKSRKHYEGEISGIAARNIPSWFERFYRPGKKIASITDWDKRVNAIAKKAKKWDIGSMAGIPSWNELMLKKVIEYNKVSHIHEIWPGLRVFASGGVSFEPYRKSFEKLLGHPITIIDTYLASEGFLAYQSRPNEQMAMTLSTNSGIYFEFVPFTEENIDENGRVTSNAPSLTLAEVENDKDYVLIISTVAGAWRYMIGDTIRFTNKELAEIVITGRTKHFLNVVGSQLSVIQMNQAMKELEEGFSLRIPEFTVAAVREGDDYIHHWYLGAEGNANTQDLEQALDQCLKEMNKAYRMARGKALKDIRVTITNPATFHAWMEKNLSKGGQVKVPRVMKQEEFAQWKTFADSYETTT